MYYELLMLDKIMKEKLSKMSIEELNECLLNKEIDQSYKRYVADELYYRNENNYLTGKNDYGDA